MPFGDDDTPHGEPSDQLERAWAHVQSGDLARALEIARRCLEYSEVPDAHNLIGFIMMTEGRSDAAVQHYRRALELDEFYLDPSLNLAEVYIAAGEPGAALEVLDGIAAPLDTPDAITEVALLRVDAHLQRSEHAEAAAALEVVPSGPFENPELEFLVARAHFDLGSIDAAAPHIEAAATSAPHNPEVTYYLGLVREAQGDRPGATLAFLQTRELEEELPPVPWSVSKQAFERVVRSALKKLTPRVSDALDGALVVVAPLPGREVVAEGVDPRLGALADDVKEGQVGRLFVYQRCCERSVSRPEDVEDAVVKAIERDVISALTHAQKRGAPPPAS